MNNYIVFNKIYFQKLSYEKLNSKNINSCILECLSKNFDVIYCILENDNFLFYGSNFINIESISFTNIENKKNYSIILNIKNITKILNKIYENTKIENFFLFRSKLINLDESYKDLYMKLLRNIKKKNNLCMYVSNFNELNIHYTNYIFDLILITNDDFTNYYTYIQNLKLQISVIMIFNMNYLLFINEQDINDIFKVSEDTLNLCHNNRKIKNFMITFFKNIKKSDQLKENILENINIVKIYN